MCLPTHKPAAAFGVKCILVNFILAPGSDITVVPAIKSDLYSKG